MCSLATVALRERGEVARYRGAAEQALGVSVFLASETLHYVTGTVIEASVCEHLDGDDECADAR